MPRKKKQREQTTQSVMKSFDDKSNIMKCKEGRIRQQLSTIEMDAALRYNRFTRKQYQGIFPVDLLPRYRLNRRPATLIVNLDPSHKPGTHWTLIHFPQSNHDSTYYFDSFGRQAIDRLEPYLTNQSGEMGRKYTFNRLMLQDLSSQSCGHFCLAVAWFLAKGIHPKRLKNFFSDSNKLHNDCILRKILRQEFSF